MLTGDLLPRYGRLVGCLNHQVHNKVSALSGYPEDLLLTGDRHLADLLTDLYFGSALEFDELNWRIRSARGEATLKTQPRAGCFWHVTRWVPTPYASISC